MCDYPQFINITTPKARKPHRCGECGERITVGEKYERISGKWDHQCSTFVQCIPCATTWNWLNTEVECLSFGGLWQGICDNDMENEIPRDILSHTMLMWLHEREIEDAENNFDVDTVPVIPPTPPGFKTVARANELNCNPRERKRWYKNMLEKAALAAVSMNYYIEEAAKGGRHGEYCAEKLTKAVI